MLVMNICIIGIGYVGLPLSCLFAERNKVFAVDIRKDVVDSVNTGICPIHEAGLDEWLKRSIKRGNLTATVDLNRAVKESNVSFICVGTPESSDGSINLLQIRKVSKQIGGVLKGSDHEHVIVIKSTVLPGTVREIVMPIIKEESKRDDIGFVMNPEFMREGSAVSDLVNAERTILGVDSDLSWNVISKLFSGVVVRTSIETAEMVKYAANCFLATKISFANEFANICERVGYNIHVDEVMKLMSMDKRINPSFLEAGRGYGGSCLPKDVNAFIKFSEKLGHHPHLLHGVNRINESQPHRIVDIAKSLFGGDLSNRHIAVLGLGFKPDTSDIRNSPAIIVIKRLLEEGARVIGFDNHASENMRSIHSSIEYANSIESALDSADAVIVLNPNKEFKNLPPELFHRLMKSPVVVDGMNVFNHELMLSSGIVYKKVGLGV